MVVELDGVCFFLEEVFSGGVEAQGFAEGAKVCHFDKGSCQKCHKWIITLTFSTFVYT